MGRSGPPGDILRHDLDLVRYLPVVMMALLPFSTLGELDSYKKVYLSGVAVFTAASALCTFSHTLLMLTVSRAMQGLGAAMIMIMSVNTSIAMLIAAVLTLCSALFSFLRIRTKTS